MKVLIESSEDQVLRATLSDGDVLDQGNAAFVRDEVTKRLGPGSLLLFSMGSVRSIDSAGVGALVTIMKAVRKHAGRMALLDVRPQILSVFKIIRLTTIFEIFPDEETALAAIAATPAKRS